MKERLRARHYVRYMDDFVLLADDRAQARRYLKEVEDLCTEHLRLRLNPRRRIVAPIAEPCDFLGYVHHPDGKTRVRRRGVRRLRRRVPALESGLKSGRLDRAAVRSSLASWMGLAQHADAFRLSRQIFTEADAANLGKRLLVASLDRPVGSRITAGSSRHRRS